MATTTHKLPETGFLRIWDIVGDKKKKTPALIPVGRTTFLNRVKEGVYPKPVKISERTTAWRVEDIRALIEKIGGQDGTVASDSMGGAS